MRPIHNDSNYHGCWFRSDRPKRSGSTQHCHRTADQASGRDEWTHPSPSRLPWPLSDGCTCWAPSQHTPHRGLRMGRRQSRWITIRTSSCARARTGRWPDHGSAYLGVFTSRPDSRPLSTHRGSCQSWGAWLCPRRQARRRRPPGACSRPLSGIGRRPRRTNRSGRVEMRRLQRLCPRRGPRPACRCECVERAAGGSRHPVIRPVRGAVEERPRQLPWTESLGRVRSRIAANEARMLLYVLL
ncbi:hypothetical protein SAMN05216554_3995 [Herbiconiux ginsengi]|uniref:Uncharacterized protein n=1 Tax=Herbiconiux ginsengi TaxID=381665 RepID=A0A1H3T4M7_9MICO|nr:hypothetical protein SAMN05216554_3995 [Herbiconiux ginsengi]